MRYSAKQPEIVAILSQIPRARRSIHLSAGWKCGDDRSCAREVGDRLAADGTPGRLRARGQAFAQQPCIEHGREEIALSTNSPGPGAPTEYKSGTRGEYEKNAFHVSQGKKLYTWYNCSGCHANGGGGSGPALMDDVWIYGSAIENIAASIREGRPKGMPTFRGKIPEDQIWQIAAYVRALGGFVASDVAASRHDEMRSHEGESRLPPPSARTSSQPGLAQPK